MDKLNDVNDEDILEDVPAFIELEVSSDKIVHLSPEQIFRIEESRKQIKSGKYLTQEEVEQHNSCLVVRFLKAKTFQGMELELH